MRDLFSYERVRVNYRAANALCDVLTVEGSGDANVSQQASSEHRVNNANIRCTKLRSRSSGTFASKSIPAASMRFRCTSLGHEVHGSLTSTWMFTRPAKDAVCAFQVVSCWIDWSNASTFEKPKKLSLVRYSYLHIKMGRQLFSTRAYAPQFHIWKPV